MREWNPNMDEAPRDGRRILVYVPPYGAMTAHWAETLNPMTDDSRWHCHACLNRDAQPTDWMPLPKPPGPAMREAAEISPMTELEAKRAFMRAVAEYLARKLEKKP